MMTLGIRDLGVILASYIEAKEGGLLPFKQEFSVSMKLREISGQNKMERKKNEEDSCQIRFMHRKPIALIFKTFLYIPHPILLLW